MKDNISVYLVGQERSLETSISRRKLKALIVCREHPRSRLKPCMALRFTLEDKDFGEMEFIALDVLIDRSCFPYAHYPS